MKTIHLFILFSFLIFSACLRKPDRINRGATEYHLTHNGIIRHYFVYLPRKFPEKGKYPLVLVFHGGGGKAETTMNTTGWPEKADENGFIVVFPEGSRKHPEFIVQFGSNGQSWNDGSGRENLFAAKKNIDDVGFINAILDEVTEHFPVDTNRIFATGFSNGASMTFRLGRELSNRLAAIAPVAGADWLTGVIPENPPSMLYITGDADPMNPLEGGEVKILGRSYGVKPPVARMMNNWLSLYSVPLCPIETETGSGVYGMKYAWDGGEEEVLLYIIAGQGHVWPGGIRKLPVWLVGEDMGKMDATDLIWDFFKRHRLSRISNYLTSESRSR
jgi:polyhydroxybutyrate depolymerase